MARTVRSSRTVSRETTRRKFVWARFQTQGSLGASSIARVSALSSFETQYGAQLIGCTIVRVRGFIVTTTTAASPALVDSRVGMIVQPNPASAPVTTEGPYGLGAGETSDWLLYEPFCASLGVAGGLSPAGRMIDNKAARRVEELNEVLSLYVQTSASGGIAYSLDLSIGVKLP